MSPWVATFTVTVAVLVIVPMASNDPSSLGGRARREGVFSAGRDRQLDLYGDRGQHSTILCHGRCWSGFRWSRQTGLLPVELLRLNPM